MKLLTQKNRKDLPPLYAQEKVKDPIVYVKFFTPTSSFTWFATEFDGEDTFFGIVYSHLCPDGELGYFSLNELQTVKGPLGLGVERDRYFNPMLLSKIKERKGVV